MAVRKGDLLQGTLDLLVLKVLAAGPNHGGRCRTRTAARLMVEESIGGRTAHADVSLANWLDWQRESRTFGRFAAW